MLLSCLVSIVCLYYAYLGVVHADPPFQLDPATWVVLDGESTCRDGGDRCVLEGDQLLRIGELDHAEYLRGATLDLRSKAPISIVLVRGGREPLELRLSMEEGRGWMHQFEALSLALVPMVLWALGTTIGLLVRPRNSGCLLLILVTYDTALWLASGSISWTHLAFSPTIFRLFVWLFLPLCLHLHVELLYPGSRRSRGRGAGLGALYGGALVCAHLDLERRLPEGSFFLPVAIALLASMILLLASAVRRAEPRYRLAVRLMLFGLFFGLGPALLLAASTFASREGLAHVLPSPLALRATFLLTVPIWPLAYGYAIYRHRLGSLQLRANRLLGAYGYLVLCLLAMLGALAVERSLEPSSDRSLPLGLLLALLFAGLGPLLLERFQRLIDSRVFGIRYRPEEVVGAFADRLSAALDRRALSELLADGILPTLLIRRSALYVFGPDRSPNPLYEQVPEEVSAEESIDPSCIERLLDEATGRYLRPRDHEGLHCAWVRLVQPLVVETRLVGVWLLGAKDPDDFYSREDIALVERLANQIAAVIRARQQMVRNRKLQEELFQSRHLEAVGRLSAGLAHDFNNLLGVIQMNTEFLRGRLLGNDADIVRYLEGISDAHERAAVLTRELLTFSRQQALDIRATDLGGLLGGLMPLLGTSIGEGVELGLELADDLPPVAVDPGKIERVVVNLVVNANDAMPEGGRLTLRARKAKASEVSRVEDSTDPGPYVLLEVEDTGCGLDPEVRSRIFDPFFTTKERGKGTGLGLSIVYGVVQQSGGFLAVDSTPGEGTRLRVFLRLAEGELEEEAEEAPEAERRGRGETLLLVEDEPALREAFVQALDERGYRVLSAGSGAEALGILDGVGEIDLLLTDVMMPGMKGTELVRHALGSRPGLEVLYMSGFNEEGVWDGTSEHSNRLLQKPFSGPELAAKVRWVLDGSAASCNP